MRRFLVPESDGPVKAGEPPTFSVLIRTHQLAETVGDAVESALAQTLPPFEVVVCDDGSTNRTEDVLRPYGDRIVYLRGGRHSGRRAPSTGPSTRPPATSSSCSTRTTSSSRSE